MELIPLNQVREKAREVAHLPDDKIENPYPFGSCAHVVFWRHVEVERILRKCLENG